MTALADATAGDLDMDKHPHLTAFQVLQHISIRYQCELPV